MAINKENASLYGNDLARVKDMLKSSSIYTDITAIIDAYEQEQSFEKDELFSSKNSEGDNKFNIVKYTEAKAFLDSGKIDKEIKELANRIKTHKYFIAKNREKDKLALDDITSKKAKIEEFASLIETKNTWNQIIGEAFPNSSKNSYIHSLPYFIDIYKDLANQMEKTCFRHLDNPEFALKLNNSLEKDMSSNEESSSEQGRSDYQFVLKVRKELIKSLEANKAKYVNRSNTSSNLEEEESFA